MIEMIPRWTKTAIIKNFKTIENATLIEGFPHHFEGDDRNLSKDGENSAYFEIRYDGPYYKQHTKNEHTAYIEISLLININRDNNDNLKFEILAGKLAAILRKCFPVYKYTVSPGNELLGYYKPINVDQDSLVVQINNFGLIEPDSKMQQGTVEAHYEMSFTT